MTLDKIIAYLECHAEVAQTMYCPPYVTAETVDHIVRTIEIVRTAADNKTWPTEQEIRDEHPMIAAYINRFKHITKGGARK